jgi:glycosyltransferase involved in cell wall biosynthesis
MIATTPPEHSVNDARICVSIGIIAWNEEEAIEATLHSLWQQTLFSELQKRNLRTEVVIIANGCSDHTAETARQFFSRVARQEVSESITCQVMEVSEKGKNNSWNLFVHSFSSPSAACLILMDADIVIQGRETLWNMFRALESDANASVAVDQPLKDISLSPRKTVCERISIATSGMTRATPAQLSGQLYCIRSQVARQIHLPRDLAACEDGFIKALVCTDFLTAPSAPERIVVAPDAAHIFESYREVKDVIRNQKRQMIGQTIVHILVDKYLKDLPLAERINLAETIRKRENTDRDWLKRLIAEHLRQVKYFWRLFPNLLRFRLERWKALPLVTRLRFFPSMIVGYAVTLVASRMAFRFLKQGSIEYWPDTRSPGLKQYVPNRAPAASSERLITPAIQP